MFTVNHLYVMNNRNHMYILTRTFFLIFFLDYNVEYMVQKPIAIIDIDLTYFEQTVKQV